MKYRIAPLPNTQHAHRFVIRDAKGTHETQFNISKESFMVWGKPSTEKLGQFMIAYVKKNGWAKEPVDVCAEKSPRNLGTYIHDLAHAKGKSK